MSEVKNLAAKLLAVQKELEPVMKAKDNPFFKSKYADINSFIEMVKPVLNKHGLILLQPLGVTVDEDFGVKQSITTIVMDADTGEKLEYTSPIISKENDPQKMGSAITYYRRYALQSFLFIQAEDDDANHASGKSHLGNGDPLKDDLDL